MEICYKIPKNSKLLKEHFNKRSKLKEVFEEMKKLMIVRYKLNSNKENEMAFSSHFEFCVGSHLAKELGIENMISIFNTDEWIVKDSDGNYRGQFGALKRNTKLYKQFKILLGNLEYDFIKDNLSRILKGISRRIEIGEYLYVIGEEEKISKDIIENGEKMKMSEFYKLLEEVKE